MSQALHAGEMKLIAVAAGDGGGSPEKVSGRIILGRWRNGMFTSTAPGNPRARVGRNGSIVSKQSIYKNVMKSEFGLLGFGSHRRQREREFLFIRLRKTVTSLPPPARGE